MNRIQSRLALIVLALVFVLAGLQAESYTDNEFLRKSRELQALAASAFDGGDYDAATAYAKEARDWALRSDEYIAKSVADARSAAQAKAEADRLAAARSEAEELLGRAAARFAWATGVNAKATYPDAYGKAGRGLGEARTAFDGSDYPLSKQRSEEVLAALAGVGEFAPWPAVYKVRLIPKRSDCLCASPSIPLSTTILSSGPSSTRPTRRLSGTPAIPTSYSPASSSPSRASMASSERGPTTRPGAMPPSPRRRSELTSRGGGGFEASSPAGAP